MANSLIERTPPPDVALLVLPNIRGLNLSQSRLEESEGLTRALGVELAAATQIHVRDPHPATMFGGGQLDNIAAQIDELHPTLLVVDGALTPIQQRNLEQRLAIKVIDRTGLILEIFGLRARTAEGRLQVELARQLYERSRLVRTWTHLERQRGGFGFLGGPGETQLEADRRMLDIRIRKLRKEIEDVRRTRRLQRSGRARRGAPVVALVGYTNAGKSTLFNRLTGADVLAADMPFATLDPTAREIELAPGRSVAVIDTVGFISDLPTHLIAAFRATLEEAVEADLLIHVRDIAHIDTNFQAEDVRRVLEQIGEEAGRDMPPTIEVWNKADLLPESSRAYLEGLAASESPPALLASAQTGEGFEELIPKVVDAVFATRARHQIDLPAAAGQLQAWLHEHCEVEAQETLDDDHIRLTVLMTDAEKVRFDAIRMAQAV